MDPAAIARAAAAARALAVELEQLAAALMPPAEAIAPDAIASQDLDHWYQGRVRDLIAAGGRSSREDDYHAALLSGLPVTHAEIRRLRARFAPAAWSAPGRPQQFLARPQYPVLTSGFPPASMLRAEAEDRYGNSTGRSLDFHAAGSGTPDSA